MSLGSIAIRVLLLSSLLLSLGIQMLQPDTGSDSRVWGTISILSTLLGVGLSFYQLNFNYDKLLDLHRVTTKKLLNVKNRMIVACESDITQSQLDEFVLELNEVYENAPQTGWLAKRLVNKTE